MIKSVIALLSFLIIFSCEKVQENNHSKTWSLKSEDKSKAFNNDENVVLPVLFDKRYFHGYQLSPDSNYPIYSHTDRYIGCVTVSFIDKDIEKQKKWLNFDVANNVDSGDDPDDEYFNSLNKIIRKKLESNVDGYNIIAEWIPAQYLSSSTFDYVYPYKKNYYLYNREKQSWYFIKEETVFDSSDGKNITKLTELNRMINNSPSNSSAKKLKIDSLNNSISLKKLDGIWSSECEFRDHVFISSTIANAQFTVTNRFSMNAELKKTGVNKYEFYFTDFPPLIPLPDEMQNWSNLDNKKPVGSFEMINESKIELTWFGFYYKKTKKYIQTENPFSKNSSKAVIINCPE
ncbi:hypothetical protein [Chryseobacterium vrystaatense]|uniref:Lipoprotein n=1 Tax=Chryseobacterium vrystaatense TaxID=307480 RepID=A0A1M4W6T7_9FLAO|nr:hypothetical protein [Chryseobacterium vrystaatense]SHE76981.1 hypothetical protein SAMN02787073_1086 [Chryseobacterium vrystaatense]